MDKIIDTRHRKHARKITITFCGNRIFSDIYNEIKMGGYEISTNYIYSSKEKDSCIINMTVKRTNNIGNRSGPNYKLWSNRVIFQFCDRKEDKH